MTTRESPTGRISLVVAAADNQVIGRGNELPWRLPADMQHFRAVTMGHPILMGRKTFESIGTALPGRRNIVLSRGAPIPVPDVETVASLEAALALCGDAEIMVIGGAQIYASVLPLAQRIYLTQVHAQPEGDAWFPVLDLAQWQEVAREARPADARNAFDLSFVTLERRGPD